MSVCLKPINYLPQYFCVSVWVMGVSPGEGEVERKELVCGVPVPVLVRGLVYI